MLLQQFILQNGHFALSLFTALVFFAVSWLYLDAYFAIKNKKDLFKVIGFWLLSISFLVHSTNIENVILTNSFLNLNLIELIANLTKILGLIFLILGLLTDSIQKKPQLTQKSLVLGIFPSQNLSNIVFILSLPILSFVVFILFLRRSTIGLEKHLKSLTFGFFFIFLYELFSLSKLFENTDSALIYKLVVPFGPIWIVTHTFLFISMIIIAKWIFGYLLKRIQTQLFMIINILVLTIFLITTVAFTGLLLSSFRKDALSHLEIDVNVVKYAIESKQEQSLSDTQLIAQSPQVVEAVENKNKAVLKDISTSFLLTKKQSFLVLLSSTGAVLARGEDNDKTGDSLSDNPLFIKAIRGENVSSIVSRDGPIAPVVSIQSAAPIKKGQEIIGVVILGTDIDNSFVDGLKKSTKLDVSIYGGNILSATTFISEDGKSRFVGIKEETKEVNKQVLNEGKNYSLDVNILNNAYFASFAPLIDESGNSVGMIFVGKQQISVIQSAARSIEYTFIIAVILLLLSILPCYLISKFVASQFK